MKIKATKTRISIILSLFGIYCIFLLGINAIFLQSITFRGSVFKGKVAVIICIIFILFGLRLFYLFYFELLEFLETRIIQFKKRNSLKFIILIPIIESFLSYLFIPAISVDTFWVLFKFYFVLSIAVILFCYTLNFSNDIFIIKESEKISLLQAAKRYWGIINSRVRNRMSESKIPYYKALYRQLRDQHQEFYYPEENNPDETNKTDSIK